MSTYLSEDGYGVSGHEMGSPEQILHAVSIEQPCNLAAEFDAEWLSG
jgi:hypothetical protein